MSVPIKDKVNIILQLLSNPKELSALLSFKHSGYFKQTGWLNAFNTKSSIGKNNEPIPWVTYSFNSFILPRLTGDLSVFEYGSGNSTLFYAKYVKNIIAVEHSEQWHNSISGKAPDNAQIKLVSDKNYAESIKQFAGKYDIIIVDAMAREECMKLAPEFLSPKGVIVLDDSEREEYTDGINFLKQSGFKSIEFWGLAPGVLFNKCTTVFYKPTNCLNI